MDAMLQMSKIIADLKKAYNQNRNMNSAIKEIDNYIIQQPENVRGS